MTMISPSVGAPFLLEIFNGGSVLLEGLFILWAVRYLWVEARRRQLVLADWTRLPPSMAFIVAVIVFDFSSWLRAVVVWSWRWFYDANAGSFTHWQLMLLIAAEVIGVTGALCKIRAVTKPDYGDTPWLVCFGVVLAFIIFSIAAT